MFEYSNEDVVMEMDITEIHQKVESSASIPLHLVVVDCGLPIFGDLPNDMKVAFYLSYVPYLERKTYSEFASQLDIRLVSRISENELAWFEKYPEAIKDLMPSIVRLRGKSIWLDEAFVLSRNLLACFLYAKRLAETPSPFFRALRLTDFVAALNTVAQFTNPSYLLFSCELDYAPQHSNESSILIASAIASILGSQQKDAVIQIEALKPNRFIDYYNSAARYWRCKSLPLLSVLVDLYLIAIPQETDSKLWNVYRQINGLLSTARVSKINKESLKRYMSDRIHELADQDPGKTRNGSLATIRQFTVFNLTSDVIVIKDNNMLMKEIRREIQVYANLSDLQGDVIPILKFHGLSKDGQYILGITYCGSLPTWTDQTKKQALEVFHKFHHAGYFHHDIKPDQFVQRDDGKMFLLDFGRSLPVISENDCMLMYGEDNKLYRMLYDE